VYLKASPLFWSEAEYLLLPTHIGYVPFSGCFLSWRGRIGLSWRRAVPNGITAGDTVVFYSDGVHDFTIGSEQHARYGVLPPSLTWGAELAPAEARTASPMISIWGEHPIDLPIYMANLTLMEFLARDSLRIVHVENYDDFALIIELSLKHAGFEQPIVRCNDGVLALHYFSMIEP